MILFYFYVGKAYLFNFLIYAKIRYKKIWGVGMNFKFLHSNIYVLDLEKSIDFYNKALGLKEVDRLDTPEFTLVYMGDDETTHQLELSWIKGQKEAYNLGDNTFHIAFEVDDYEKAHELHEKMGCICYENKEMGIYFINDPDGNWMEVIPKGRF